MVLVLVLALTPPHRSAARQRPRLQSQARGRRRPPRPPPSSSRFPSPPPCPRQRTPAAPHPHSFPTRALSLRRRCCRTASWRKMRRPPSSCRQSPQHQRRPTWPRPSRHPLRFRSRSCPPRAWPIRPLLRRPRGERCPPVRQHRRGHRKHTQRRAATSPHRRRCHRLPSQSLRPSPPPMPPRRRRPFHQCSQPARHGLPRRMRQQHLPWQTLPRRPPPRRRPWQRRPPRPPHPRHRKHRRRRRSRATLLRPPPRCRQPARHRRRARPALPPPPFRARSRQQA